MMKTKLFSQLVFDKADVLLRELLFSVYKQNKSDRIGPDLGHIPYFIFPFSILGGLILLHPLLQFPVEPGGIDSPI